MNSHDDRFERALKVIASYLGDGDGDGDGEIMIPFDHGVLNHTVKVGEKVVIEKPTMEKVLRTLRRIAQSGFSGRVHVPRKFSDPLVIVVERVIDPGRVLLLEGRR